MYNALKIFRNFIAFNLPNRNYYKNAYTLQNLYVRLSVNNDRRRELQKEIVTLCRKSNACLECQGLCCRGNYNHFTIIDYVMRSASDQPITEYGSVTRLKPWMETLANKIRSLINKEQHYVPKETGTRCPNLGPEGCIFTSENRPVLCVLWTCKFFRNSLNDEDLSKLELLTKELTKITKLYI